MKFNTKDFCMICMILAVSIGGVLLGAAVGYSIMTIWGTVGKVVLTIELLLIATIVIVKSLILHWQ